MMTTTAKRGGVRRASICAGCGALVPNSWTPPGDAMTDETGRVFCDQSCLRKWGSVVTWTRQDIEALKGHERPLVRVRITSHYEEDGRRVETVLKDHSAWISVDGNNPWLVTNAGGQQLAFRCSWGLVCEVLNDKYAAPVHFDEEVTYQR